MPTNLESWGQKRYISTTGANTTAYAMGNTGGRLNPYTLDAGSFPPRFPMGKDEGDKNRGAEIEFFGSTSGSTISFRVLQGKRGKNPAFLLDRATSTSVYDYEVQFLGFGTFTTSTALVGATGISGAILSNEYIADTITYTVAGQATTPAGIGSAIISAMNAPTPVAYSPQNNIGPARLYLPDCGNAEFILVDFQTSAANIWGNALIERST